jgi:hypothetical protein
VATIKFSLNDDVKLAIFIFCALASHDHVGFGMKHLLVSFVAFLKMLKENFTKGAAKIATTI